MPSHKFSDKMLRGLNPAKVRTEIWDEMLPGFGLRVGTSGTKTFFVGVRIRGKYKRITLKPLFPHLELADARNQARQIMADAQAGIGPDVRRKRSEKGTFKAVADAFMKDFAHSHRTRKEMQRKIDVDLREWHDMQITDVPRSTLRSS